MISDQIWDMKYRLKDVDGTPIDQTVEDTWLRIASALAEAEDDKEYWSEVFYEALSDYKFLPAGRITAGAGTGRDVTLFNCFVMDTIEDDMASIFDGAKEAALTMQQGGGVGYDFSTIRPKGALVRGVAAAASGPLSFMDVWDSTCRTIMSAGSRRGAMMATLRCDHPDVLDFIEAKIDPARLRMFNMSILVTDDFMEAVAQGADWDLVWEGEVWRTLPAVDLWNKIMEATYAYAEPGVIFIDRINQTNNLNYCETIAATNPCGEQPLPPYGACLLGSINLAKLVQDPFEETAHLDRRALAELVAVAVRMMDNVVDVSKFPLPEQEAEAKAKRRIGLGVTGLADALLMLGLRYGSDEAARYVEDWMSFIADEAYMASVHLAKEKGAFPLFDRQKYQCLTVSPNVREQIYDHGIRNALLTSIAPTGTISLYAGNVSSGIEPVFAYAYTRKVRQADGSHLEEEVVDYAVQLWREKFGEAKLPDYFVNAQTLSPSDHVKMQAAAQKYVDSSISKTINCPEDISFDDFKDVYMQAWQLGCKGCTTYRPNDITGSVLSVSEPKKEKKEEGKLIERPEQLEGKTYKLKWPELDRAFYVTINDAEPGVPLEIFINSQNVESQAWVTALTRMISAVFRRGGDMSFVAEELKAIFDPRGGAFVNGRYVPSLQAAIGGIIEEHLGKKTPAVPSLGKQREGCPDYGNCNVIREDGCTKCLNCGWSKCG